MPVKITEVKHVAISLQSPNGNIMLSYDNERAGGRPIYFGVSNSRLAYSVASFQEMRDLINEFNDALIKAVPEAMPDAT